MCSFFPNGDITRLEDLKEHDSPLQQQGQRNLAEAFTVHRNCKKLETTETTYHAYTIHKMVTLQVRIDEQEDKLPTKRSA